MLTCSSPNAKGSERAGFNFDLQKLLLSLSWFTTVRRFYTSSKVDPADAP